MDVITGDLRYVERGEIAKIGNFPASLYGISCSACTGRSKFLELIHLPALPVFHQARRSLPETPRKILILQGRQGICWLSRQLISLNYIELHVQASAANTC